MHARGNYPQNGAPVNDTELTINDPAVLAQAGRMIRTALARQAERELTRNDVELAA